MLEAAAALDVPEGAAKGIQHPEQVFAAEPGLVDEVGHTVRVSVEGDLRSVAVAQIGDGDVARDPLVATVDAVVAGVVPAAREVVVLRAVLGCGVVEVTGGVADLVGGGDAAVAGGVGIRSKIGRASCRERVCQYG